MTPTSAAESERQALTAALLRTLRGETTSGSGHVSAQAIAAEAGLARTSLTHRHRDLNQLIALVKDLDKKARHNAYDEIHSLRVQNAELRALNDSLAAQVTVMTMRLQDLGTARPLLTAVPPTE